MIVLSNTTTQTIQPGQSITFDNVVLQSGCAEYHRGGTSSIRLRRVGIYELHFTGNIAATAANDILQLAIKLDGDTLPETTMIQTPAAVDAYANISAATVVRNCTCDNNRVTVTNTGTTPINLAPNAGLFVKRVA